MPKSKRKARYIARPKVQQPISGTLQASATVSNVSRLIPAPASKNTTMSPKTTVMPQVNIGTELKVIGITTLALFVLIFVFYFLLR